MKKGYIIGLTLFISALALTGCANNFNLQEKDTSRKETEKATPALVFSEMTFDFGVIKQSGGKVSHDFEFTYSGVEPIKITSIPTSCACISAKVSPINLNPGESGVVSLVFNPNLHAEPEGKFFKTAIVLTEPELKESIELKIWTEIDLDLGEQAFELKSDHDNDEEGEEELSGYNPITAEKFDGMLQKKDFVLIDVHIPEQDHINGTDLFIPYNDIENFKDQLPKNKNEKIVVYCRSGSMSRAASYILAEHGYNNIYDLIGGKNAYVEFLKTK